MADIVAPSFEDRIAILGATGQGKTRLARAILDQMPRYIALDRKGDFPTRRWDHICRNPRDLAQRREWPDRVIYRAPAPYNGGEWLDYVLALCYHRAHKSRGREGRWVHVDEGFALARRGYTVNLSNIATEGRSLNLGLSVCSVRPRWIPPECMSMAVATGGVYVFTLAEEPDEKRVLEMAKGQLTLEGLRAQTRKFGFVCIRWTPGEVVPSVEYFEPIDLSVKGE